MTGQGQGRGVMWISVASLGMLLVAVPGAWAQEELERMAMARLRLTTEAATAAGCTRIGRVSDDSIKDLRRKIVRAGGDTAVLSFGIADMSQIYADVYRCTASSASPPATNLPAGIPPPPPGPPPPPPPGPSR